MARNDKMDRFPRTLQPWHYEVLLLHVQGVGVLEIGRMLEKSKQTISNVINSPLGKGVLETIRNQTINTMRAVQTRLQTIAPEIVEKLIDSAHNAPESSSRVRAQVRLLEMAGHTVTQHMIIERPDAIQEEYAGMTDEEIKEKVLGKIAAKPPKDKGPDGSLLQ